MNIEELKTRASVLLAASGLGKTEITVCDEDYCTKGIELDHTGIGVMCEDGEYWAYRTDFHPGVYYYPDGSGEPPSEDIVDIGKRSKDPSQPLVEAIKAMVGYHLDDFLVAEAEKEIDKL